VLCKPWLSNQKTDKQMLFLSRGNKELELGIGGWKFGFGQVVLITED
jgi:hypothetical protein